MPTQWAVVADDSRARIFARISLNGSWQDIDDIRARRSEPASNGREQRLPDASLKLHDADLLKRGNSRSFADTLAEHLSIARKRGDFDQLILVAPAGILEELRNSLDTATRRKLTDAAEADLVGLPLKTTRRELARLF